MMIYLVSAEVCKIGQKSNGNIEAACLLLGEFLSHFSSNYNDACFLLFSM